MNIDNYKTYLDTTILKCLNACSTSDETEVFLKLINHLYKNYKEELFVPEYYIINAIKNSTDSALGDIYESILNEILKDLLGNENILDSISFHVLTTDFGFNLSIEYYTIENFQCGERIYLWFKKNYSKHYYI
jgi:hypothetical protein